MRGSASAIRSERAAAGPVFTISNPRAKTADRRSEPVFGTGGKTASTAGTGPVIGSAGHGVEMEGDTEEGDFLFVEPRAGRRSGRYKPEFLDGAPSRRGWMTPVWIVLILCGLAVLVLQGVYVYRAQLANTFPGLRPSLEAACERIACSVPYERRIDAIAITGSALRSSAAPQDDVSSLTLEVTLRNTYERPQEWPTLVLDLKDASGTVVVRRNLAPSVWVPAELRDGPFAAGSEVIVQVPVAVRGLQANGYQLDKFFP